MSILDEPWFSQIKRPSRYIGNEINSIRKDPAAVEVSIALAFPDVYEVGMSHLGLKILYHTLNSHTWLAAERIFSPWTDLEEELRERRIPLPALESGRPLLEFDIVGFSLQHELSFTNVLNILNLSGIPFLSEQRDDSFPLIIAGGPACFNPEPVADFFDAMVIGDGEETALEICRRVQEVKRAKPGKKQAFLSELTQIDGVYVPHLFKPHYRTNGVIHSIEPLLEHYEEVKKAIISDINYNPSLCRQVVPFAELIHDRLVVEISRGCTRGCRFCQAGMIYRPTRERSPASVIDLAGKSLKETGFEELSLLSLSSGDYSCLDQLLEELMDRHAKSRVSISLPSLRIDSLNPSWFDQIKRVRKTGFTLAPEAGSDRLKRVINKSLTNKEILNIAPQVYRAGWNLIKLYFMIGLPTENDEDLQQLVDLVEKLAYSAKKEGERKKLHVSVATFVPKAHTPFMWMPQLPIEESRRRIQFVRSAFNDKRIRVKWNQPELSWLEGVFSRGDRRLSKTLIEAWRLGARFDAWGEHFNMDIWKQAFALSNLDPDFYLYRPRSTDEVLPWEHIKSGVSRRYLLKESEKALRGEISPDCRQKCLECGVCDHKRIRPVLYKDWDPPVEIKGDILRHDISKTKRCRITFSKTLRAKYLGHLELVRLFIRAFKRAGLNLVYSKGFHPMPKISFTCALPVGTESIHETVEIELSDNIPISLLREKIARQLPDGIRILHFEEIPHDKGKLTLKESHYHIALDGLQVKQADLDRFLQSKCFPVSKTAKGNRKTIDARSLVKSIYLVPPSGLNLIITHDPGPKLKPIDIIKGVFHLSGQETRRIKILKTNQVMIQSL
ncbi:MAG: TIGR03960 family B12-binding radical SAM protein [Deltaproteobacteria bacterium]|nr:TIGR03960 family B12-binding radical SAM protein [Deltaproteobacteria bacterium]